MELISFEPCDRDRPACDWRATIETGFGWFTRRRIYQGSGIDWMRYNPYRTDMVWSRAPGDVQMFLAAAWSARKWKELPAWDPASFLQSQASRPS